MHAVVGTAGNVSVVTQAHTRLHAEETAALGERRLSGRGEASRILARRYLGGCHEMLRSQDAAQKQTGPHNGKIGAFEGQRTCASEHPLHVIKNLFHHRKTRYRGLAKNTAQLSILLASSI